MSVSIWEGSRAERVAAALEEIAASSHIIDDTAGTGDLDKTWSANKLASIDDDVSDLKDAVDDLQNDVGDLTDEVDLKVNKPTTSPDGTSGQLLRTNGDGTTTWVDVGTPTDAQVDDAVSDWLDAHPEATTTVEDGSITAAKLSSGLVATAAEVKTYLGIT